MKFCPQCGAGLACASWPCTCASCGTTHYRNPKPVAVAVVPVCAANDTLVGLLGVKRSATTGKGAGRWALPGGFIEWGEDLLAGAVRELREETAIDLPADQCQLLTSAASSDGSCALVFILTPPITQEQAAAAVACETECQAVGVLTSAKGLAFPTHAAIVDRIMQAAREGALG